MFKKILLLSVFLFGCDSGTNPTVPETIPGNPTLQRVTISDTILVKKKVISGKISQRSSAGKDVGGFSAIVCSDAKRTCVQTDENGEYFMNFESTIFKGSARRLVNEDSLYDTIPSKKDTAKIDTTPKVQKIDSTKKDTVKITYRKFVPQVEEDTVVIWKDSKKIYEKPISSWLNILPPDYIVQRNISGKIVQNDYVSELKSVEGVFWSIDSLATVIPLEVNGDRYSGFIYQHYNDSSFKNSIRMFNLFVRILDKSDSVYGLTPVLNYSERSGDLNFADIVPGGIARYPRPNYFRVIKEGSNVSIVVDSVQKISTNKKWYALDSLYLRPTFKDRVDIYPESKDKNGYTGMVLVRFLSDTAFRNVAKNLSDSIGFMIDAKEDGKVCISSQTWEDSLYVTKGINFVAYPKERVKDLELEDVEYHIFGRVEKVKIYLHLK